MKRVRFDSRGVVMMEFIIAILPVLIAFLGFVQLAFLAMAKLSVHHAAALATRAATVVLEEADVKTAGGPPGSPDNIYSDLPAGALEVSKPDDKKGSSKAGVAQSQSQVSAASSSGSSSKSTTQNMQDIMGGLERTDSRIKQIRTAAYWPLLAVSPDLTQDGIDVANSLLPGESAPKLNVKSAIGTAGYRRIMGAFMYNMGAVAVTFPTAPGEKELTGGLFQPHDMLNVRVTYLFRCQVPLVSLIMCSSGWALLFGSAWIDPFVLKSVASTVGDVPQRPEDLPAWSDEWRRTKAMRVDAFKGHEAEFKQVEWPFMLDVLLALPGARYVVLQSEASLPLQGAEYYKRATTDDMEDMWKKQEQKQQQGGGSATPGVADALKPVGDAVAKTADQIDSEVTSAKQAIDDVRSTAADAKKTASSAQQTAKSTAQSAKTAKQQSAAALRGIQQTAKGAGSEFKDAASQAVGAVKQDVTNTTKNVEDQLKKSGKSILPQGISPSEGMSLDDFTQ
jgi:hypothetical protein